MIYVTLFLYLSGALLSIDSFDDDDPQPEIAFMMVTLWFLAPWLNFIGDEE